MSTATPEQFLPPELWWAEGDHASDVVLTAIADGQVGIVPPEVRAHVEQCPACMRHLGHAALLSLHAGRDLERLRRRRPLPGRAIAAALAFAGLGLVPSLAHHGVGHLIEGAPLFVRGASTLWRVLRRFEPSVLTTYGVAILLLCAGLAAVRVLPKKETSR